MKNQLHYVVLCLAGGMFLAGCAGPKQAEPSAAALPAFRMMGESATPEESPSDETIGQEVRRRLNLVGTAQTMGVIVEVDEGVVTLRGVAMTQEAIFRATAAAAAVPGVKRVVNQVLIGGASQSVY